MGVGVWVGQIYQQGVKFSCILAEQPDVGDLCTNADASGGVTCLLLVLVTFLQEQHP